MLLWGLQKNRNMGQLDWVQRRVTKIMCVIPESWFGNDYIFCVPSDIFSGAAHSTQKYLKFFFSLAKTDYVITSKD